MGSIFLGLLQKSRPKETKEQIEKNG